MAVRFQRWIAVLLAVCCLATAAELRAAPSGAVFKAGFAERDITPELGMEVPGGYGKAYARTIHDPCKVRAAVFDDGRSRVALVSVDGGFIFRGVVQAARQAIYEQCGIRPEAVLIGATHSHSAGPLGMVQPGQYDDAAPLVRTLAYEKSSCADAKYLEHVRRQIVAAVCQADQGRATSRCGLGKGIEDKVAFNRRQRMKNGLTYTHAGQGNPDILGYAGPADPEVGVLGSWDGAGKLQGAIVNFACHATTNPGGISANYIYYLEQTIRGSFGPQAIVLFFPGDSGDVTQVDNLSPYANPPGERWAQIVGGRVGAEAVKVLLSMERGPLAPVDARSKLLRIARRVPRPDRVRQCLELVKKEPKEVGATEWAFAKEIVLLDALLAHSPRAEVEVQAIQVGAAVFLASPGELFCEYQLQQKARSPFPMTFCVSVANDFVGYVPTDEALGPHGGGYETRLTSVSNLEVGAGRRIVETALELARQMTPGTLPVPAKAPPFRQPWPYGDVSAELQ
jgi:hypothetical protein